MRLLAGAIVVATLALIASATAAGSVAPLPTDVRDGLARESSIKVGSPTGAPAHLPVSATRAKRIVGRDFDRRRLHKMGVYLVRVTGHPGLLDPVPPGQGWSSIDPLEVGDLAWIVVIRNVPTPSPVPGGAAKETLAVIVETTRPRWVFGITIPPSR